MSAPIVPVVQSKGNIRLCGDYRLTANTVIDSGSYYLPSFNEIVQQLANFDWFSKIDFQSKAYLQLSLDPNSQRLTIISTHLGHFNFTRLPFGISASSLIFQHYMDWLLADLDDILIGAKTMKEHDDLSKVDRLADHSLQVANNKCIRRIKKVKFWVILSLKMPSLQILLDWKVSLKFLHQRLNIS